MTGPYHPARIIRSEFGDSLGIEGTSFQTVEEALADGRRRSLNPDDWKDNWTVVVESGHDRFTPVPDEVVSYMKGGFRRHPATPTRDGSDPPTAPLPWVAARTAATS